jgi:hypothetical protein
MTEQETAQKAAGETWRWFGNTDRPWVKTDNHETNLVRWFIEHWRQHPRTAPGRTIDNLPPVVEPS